MRTRLGLISLMLACATLPAGAAPDCDWSMYGHDEANTVAQSDECAEFSRPAAASLRPKWFERAADSVTASPAVVDGVVYVGSWDGRFVALDAADGSEIWDFEIDDEHEVAFGRIVSSAWVGPIRVKNGGGFEQVDAVVFGGGGSLYALDPVDGSLLARVDVDPRTPDLRAAQADDPPQIEIESSPVVGRFGSEGDRVFVGMDVHNREGVGRTGLLSFELKKATGTRPYQFVLKYKFDPETGTVRHSLTDGSGTGWGCGGVWSSPVVDEDALNGEGIVVFGTANCDNPQQSAAAGEVGREGIFAIEAKSGDEVWRFHPRGPNTLDDDFGASPNLIASRGWVGQAGKDGRYYMRDLLTGAEIWRARVGQSGHVSDGFAIGGFIGTPALGSVNGEAALIGTTALPTPQDADEQNGSPFAPLDTSLAEDPGRLFSLVALAVDDGAVLWRSPLTLPSYAGPSYADGIVFVPDTFGVQLQVLDADTGAVLRAIPLPGPPASVPAIVGDSITLGVGVRETDAEFKAFGNELGELFGSTIGEHPLSPFSGIVSLTTDL